MGGVNELPSRQTGSVGWSGDHRPDCARRGVRLARRRDATSTVKHYSIVSGRPCAAWAAGCGVIYEPMRALTIALCGDYVLEKSDGGAISEATWWRGIFPQHQEVAVI